MDNEIRVAVVLGSLAPVPPIRGGAPAIVVYNLTEHMSFPEAHMVIFSRWEPSLDAIEYDRQRYRAVKQNKYLAFLIKLIKKAPYRFYKPILNKYFRSINDEWINYSINVCLQVRNFCPDIIVCHAEHSLVYLLRSFNGHAKLIFYDHSGSIQAYFSEKEWRRFEDTINGLIAVSKTTFDNIEKKFGPSSLPKWLIHNGVDTKLFHPLEQDGLRIKARRQYGIGENDFIFLYSGRFVRAKGIHHLLNAFDALQKDLPQASLIIIGSSEKENWPDFNYEKELVETAKTINGFVKFIGWIPNSDMPGVLGMADVMVLPSVSEGTPLSLLESMACGIPVIATAVGGVPEIVCNGKNGLLIPIENIEDELLKAMRRFVFEKEFWKSCSANSVKFVTQNHTYDIVSQKFLEVLEEIRQDKTEFNGENIDMFL